MHDWQEAAASFGQSFSLKTIKKGNELFWKKKKIEKIKLDLFNDFFGLKKVY